MRLLARRPSIALASVLALGGCSGGSSTPSTPVRSALPAPSTTGAVPSSVRSQPGYAVSVFATLGGATTKPDSIVQDGDKILVGTGDTVGPDGTPGPTGVAQTEVLEYDLSGTLLRTFEVPGHNDGLMAYDAATIWAMSNEDANPKLVIIDLGSGVEHVYTAQASLLTAGALPHGGGLDDMAKIGGTVYVSGSNPSTNATATCPADSSTPGCPNGVSAGAFAYALTLNADGSTFALAPVATSSTRATDLATNASGTVNVTDPDSETVAPDGSLVVDGQGDAELTFVSLGATPAVTYLPLTLAGAPEQVDDTRYVASATTFALLADTPSNTIYRIDSPSFVPGDAYSSGAAEFVKLNVATGVATAAVSGFRAPHGLAFVTAP